MALRHSLNFFKNMEKKEETGFLFKRIAILYLPKFAIGLVIATLICILYLSLKGYELVNGVDACFYSSIVMIGVALLSFITNKGFFDIFAYNGLKIKYYFNPKAKKEENPFFGTYEYTKSKTSKRDNNKYVFLSYLVVGILYLIPTIILYIIYKTM